MNNFFRFLVILILIPASVFIPSKVSAINVPASFSASRSLISANPSLGNSYNAGISVVVTAPVAGDLSAVGGSITVASPVAGDGLLFAGSVNTRAPIKGSLRTVGGNISIEKPIGDDLIAFGLSLFDSGRAEGSVFVVAINTTLTDGASGPVLIYGNNVSLAGDFSDDVKVIAGGRLALAPDTIIRGTLSYEAPETAIIPESAKVIGGIEYKNISYLPDAGTSRMLSFVSVGFFLFVRILGAIILAGLLAGLFPRLAELITERAYTARPRRVLLTVLLGFAVLVATPILIIMLLLTFVGIGIALLISVLYALIVLLSLLYSGILLGGVLIRRYARRNEIRWHDGALGMLVFSIIALVPFIGLFLVLLLTTFSAGTLLFVFFNFAFPHEGQTSELL